MINDKIIQTDFWDLPSDARFQLLRISSLRLMSGFILVYSVIDRNSFEKLGTILKTLEDNECEDIPRVLVGTKTDCEEKGDRQIQREVSKEEAEKFAEEKGMLYFEVSCSNGKDVSQPFEALLEILFEQWETQKVKNVLENSVRLQSRNQKEESRCGAC